jgi:HEPN domain-containing protein
MERKVRYWLELAEYDIDTAWALFEKKRYLYVGFMCHQVIEKVVKAYWVFSKKSFPPKIHNIAYLLENSGLDNDMPERYKDFIDELDPLNIECRYPEYKEYIYKRMNEYYTKTIYSKTKELYEWIKTKLS